MEILVLLSALGAAAGATGAIWKFWGRPAATLIKTALYAAIDIRNLLEDLRPIAENQERILRLLDENGGGWRDRSMKRIEKIEHEQAETNILLREHIKQINREVIRS